MFLFVGLGNPGKEYERNRHNVGFMAVDQIARDYNFPDFKKKYSGEYSEGNIGNQKIAILKPQTFMNLSGRSVAPCVNFYKIPLNQVFVFYDELDLEPCKIRIKSGGGSGGHNGIKSLDECLGDPHYTRVRIGIGHPGHKDRVHGYVLGNFTSEEQDNVSKLCDIMSKHVALLLKDQTNDFMSKVQMDMNPKPPKDMIQKKEISDGI